MRLHRLWKLGLVGIAALLFLSGCGGHSEQIMRVDDAVEATEDALTTLLLGPPPDPTSLAPLDKPLLVKGTHDTVYIAIDEPGFVGISHGTFKPENLHEIEERVVKTINANIKRKGFSAQATSYPVPSDLSQQPHALIATLLPSTEDTGSPQDHARGRNKQLVIIRLIVSDAATGAVLAERDYYSGADVHRDVDGKLSPLLYRRIK
jgi:hypothetical protein